MKSYGSVLDDHQLEALAQGLAVLRDSPLHGFYLAHSVGMGKTVTAIALARLLEVKTLAIVTTVNGVNVWKEHLKTWWPDLDRDQVAVYPLTWGELVATGGKSPADQTHRRVRVQRRIQSLVARAVDLVILDESQVAKSASSDVSRAAWKLERSARYRLRLSGTPQHNYFDLWAQYRYLCPHPIFQGPYRDYKRRIAVFKGPDGNWFDSWKEDGLAEVAAAIAPYTHVADNQQLQLPEPIETVVPVTLSEREREVYNHMEQDCFHQFERGSAEARIVLTKLLRLQQITSGHLPAEERVEEGDTATLDRWTEVIGSSKLDAVLAEVDRRPDQKLLIGCRFLNEMVRLEEALTQRGRWFGLIKGGVSARQRGQLEAQFQRGNRPDIILMQFSTATAMTLTEADAVLIASIDPKVINYQQFIGRAQRRGQRKRLEVLTFVATNTIDQEVLTGVRMGADLAAMSSLLRRGIAARQWHNVPSLPS